MRFFHYALGTLLTLAALTSDSTPVVEAIELESKAADLSAIASIDDASDFMSTEESVALAQTSVLASQASTHGEASSMKGAHNENLTA